MSKRHVKAYPRKFREQVVKLALSCGLRSVRSPRSSRSRWIRCGDVSSWQSSTSVHENAGTSVAVVVPQPQSAADSCASRDGR